jgi:murein DD-endopeptidase MepM/ murein hydrolase activator NlpD
MKQLRKMSKTPLLKLSLLGLCFTLGGSLVLCTEAALAGQKSTISPEVTTPKAAPSVNPAPEPVAAPPVQAPIPIEKSAPTVEIQTGRNTQAVAPAVEIQSRSSTVTPKPAQNSGNVDIVFESRTTGCQANGRDLSNRQANLCAPEIASDRNQPTNLVYSATGEPVVQVRKLTPSEIASMSVPSNGDKQMLFPLSIPAIISSSFGYRVHPITQAKRFHQGTDIAADAGTPVIAAYSGKVEISGWMGGYGIAVVISHGDTHETRYAHLSEVFVKPGQEVKQGTVIGLVGSTGFSTGPHLHFELWEKNGGGWTVMDPTPHLILALDRLNVYLAQQINPVPKNKPTQLARPAFNPKVAIAKTGIFKAIAKTAKG